MDVPNPPSPARGLALALLGLLALVPDAPAASDRAAERYRDQIQPILEDRCYSCHGNGIKKGGLSLEPPTPGGDDALLKNQALWSAVLKNVRAGLMPPRDKPRPSADEVAALADWTKRDVFGIDPDDIDPGRVTLRRLNRGEYRNTVRDLMGIDFRTEEEFPPDDTGYGFDNIGDVLTVSPLLLEKYVQAAETIVSKAVPLVSRVVNERTIDGNAFVGPKGKPGGERLDFYEEATVSHAFRAGQDGDYRLALEFEVMEQFDFDPGRCAAVFKVDGRERVAEEFGWANRKRFKFDVPEHFTAGDHAFTVEVVPLTAVADRRNKLELRLVSVRVVGPLDEKAWVYPKNYERFFFKGTPPKTVEARRVYAREVLDRFATKAYRRPVDEPTLDRLMSLVGDLGEGGDGFEASVSRALVAVIASPRFVFRVEKAEATDKAGHFPLLDEYALASRLSYLLWSTMPDEELFGLASRGELRKDLDGQVDRMLKEPKADALVKNFVGQWLQVRDVDSIAINAGQVLARDKGVEKDLERERKEFLARINDPKAPRPKQPPRFFRPAVELDGPLRKAMREETEMAFGHVVKDDRSVLELIDADYTFANERLAKHYGLPGVKGPEMRKVLLPSGHFRGGVLTQGSVLVVTSNPTRTSPVKRGLFLLENLLGTPAPPPPPDIPTLEEAEKAVEGHEPTMRESMALHRAKPLCSSCHARMDPLGLALENFNAMGMFRETERGQPIDPTGVLLTGESFKDVRDVKRVLTHERRGDFYRTLTEKFLTYALGRGVDDLDTESVDRIAGRLEASQGKFSSLLMGVIESSPFQKTRRPGLTPTPASHTTPSGTSP